MEKSLIYAIKYKSKRKNRGHVFVVRVWECVEGARGRNQHFSDCEEERGLGVGTGRKPVVDFSNLYPLKKKNFSQRWREVRNKFSFLLYASLWLNK